MTEPNPLGEESPMQKAYDEFDVSHIDWTANDYIKYAMQLPVEETNKLMLTDFKWRKGHKQNVVASVEGFQGKGKSMPFCYLGLLLGEIFEVKFTTDYIFFSPEDLDVALGKAKPKETFLRDEHLKANVGRMSHMIEANLADYEDQLRINQNNLLFAAVELQQHSHFFCFEAKHTIWTERNGEPYPAKFISILKTPRYTNRHEFVWRGSVSFLMPNDKFVEEYLIKKNNHIANLKAKYGNTLDPIKYYADLIFEKRKDNLIKRDRCGFVSPINRELMDFIIAEEIGTRRFTVAGYDILNALIRERIKIDFEAENQQVFTAVEQAKLMKKQETDEQKVNDLTTLSEQRKIKQELQAQKLAEEKRKNDLRERMIQLKEQEILNKKKVELPNA